MNEFKLNEVVSIKPLSLKETVLFFITTGIWGIPRTGRILGYRTNLIAYEILTSAGDIYMIAPDRIIKSEV